MSNQFYVDKPPHITARPWDVHQPPDESLPVDCHYFGEALARADEWLGDRGLSFYMVWDLDHVPETGRHVVVLMVADERYQTPSYADKVLAVFKISDTKTFRPLPILSRPTLTKLLDHVREGRDAWLRHSRRRLTGHIDAAARARIFPIPLGYHKQIDVPYKPLEQRTIDLFFAGGMGAVPSLLHPGTWPRRPAVASRAAMAKALRRFAGRHPQSTCRWVAVRGGISQRLGPLEYSQQMMESKIALCPRGNFPETYRFFEASRAGCVIISEPLPDLWYYRGHPAIFIRHWSELGEVAARLLASPDEMQRLHQRTLDWWRTTSSGAALGTYIADCVRECLA